MSDKIERTKYGHYNFFKNEDRFDFGETICSMMKQLTFNYEVEGHNSPKVLVCRIEDNIEMIKKHCGSEKKAHEYFQMCYPAIWIFVRWVELPEDFKKKYKVKPWHEYLMRRTYFDIEMNSNEWSYTKSDCEIYIGDKRPYGNSYVAGDISESYYIYNDVKYKGKTYKAMDVGYEDAIRNFTEDNEDFFFNIMHETNDIIRKALKEVDFSSMAFVRNKNKQHSFDPSDWEYCTSVIRNKKIDKLVSNE